MCPFVLRIPKIYTKKHDNFKISNEKQLSDISFDSGKKMDDLSYAIIYLMT